MESWLSLLEVAGEGLLGDVGEDDVFIGVEWVGLPEGVFFG